MTDKPTLSELQERIHEVAEFHGGHLPVEHALAWTGYVAALLEWQLISESDHGQLLEQIGPTHSDAALSIYLGPEGARDVIQQRKLAKEPSSV